MSRRTETSDLRAGLHQIDYNIPSQILHHSLSMYTAFPRIRTAATWASAHRRHELVSLQTLKTFTWIGWRAKSKGFMSWPCLLITVVSPETRWVTVDYSVCNVRCMQERPVAHLLLTYSVHVQCTQNGCDLANFMTSCRVTITLSGPDVFRNNTLNGILATASNKEARKSVTFYNDTPQNLHLFSCHY